MSTVLPSEFGQRNFALTSFTDSWNRQQPAFFLTAFAFWGKCLFTHKTYKATNFYTPECFKILAKVLWVMALWGFLLNFNGDLLCLLTLPHT